MRFATVPVSKEYLVIRFRFTALLAAAIVVMSAGAVHPASAAPKPAPTPTASPAPAPTPTPETLNVQIPRLEAAVKANPNDKDSMIQLAGDYLQVQRPDLAADLTTKLLASGTKTAQVYYIDGEAQAALNVPDKAIGSMEQAANLEPTNMLVLQSLTQLYMAAKRPADAERVAKRALTFNAGSKEAAENYGFVLGAEQKYDEARQQFEAAAKLDPKDAHPIVLEARTYEDQKSLPLAQQTLDRALAVDPKSLEALIDKAQVTSAQHDIKTSIATYNTIASMFTDNVDLAAIYDQMAIAYAREKDDANADATFRKAIDAYGGLPQAHVAYGDYLGSKGDKAGAVREWTTGAGPNRDNPDALARLAAAAAESNDFGKAVDNYKRLTEVQSSDNRPFLLLGQAYLQQHNWNAARDAFKSSYNLVHTPDALVGLASADQQMHNYNEAIQIYEAIAKGAPQLVKSNPQLLFSLGQAYQGANQPQKAKTVYTSFLTYLKPGTQGYTQVKGIIASIDHPSNAQAKPKPKASPTAAPKK